MECFYLKGNPAAVIELIYYYSLVFTYITIFIYSVVDYWNSKNTLRRMPGAVAVVVIAVIEITNENLQN